MPRIDPTPRMSICMGSSYRQRELITNCDFFNAKEEVIVKVYEDKMVFRKPTLDYMGATYTPQPTRSNKWKTIPVTAPDLPLYKQLKFDPEESNEDQMVIYFDQQ